MSPSLGPCWSSGNHSLRLFQKTVEGFDSKINGRALLTGQMGMHKYRAFPTWLQLLRGTTCSLEDKVLPRLLSSRVKRVLIISDAL